MTRQTCYIAALLMTFFASTGMAATVSFWAEGNSDSAENKDLLSKDESKKITINYVLGNDWIINSAKLWLRAVDDLGGNDCAPPNQISSNCNDDNIVTTPQDVKEQAKVTVIEDNSVTHTAVEIDNFKWYDLNINVASYLSNTDKKFNATIKAIGGDFWYKNSKIVVDYSLKPVPIPAALWLFGSALLGLTGMKRKSIAPAVAI